MPNSAGDSIESSNALPFVAPCRSLSPTAPLVWLRLGWRDVCAASLASLFYGALLTVLSALIAWATWQFGTLAMYLGLASGFVFVGPFLAMGLYSISRALEACEMPRIAHGLHAGAAHMRELAVLGVCLLVVLLVWARAATIMSVFRPDHAIETWTDLLPYLGIGSAVGAVFAAIVFAASAFSLPMLLDRRVDAVTAVITSINAVLRNKLAAVLWGTCIVALVLVGFATFLIGFIVILPLIGHATWHAYRATIDASAWPATPQAGQ